MEIKTEVKVYNVDMECPQCHKGKMRPTGACLDFFHLYIHINARNVDILKIIIRHIHI